MNDHIQDKPWVTESLKYELKIKNKLFFKAKMTNLPKDWNAFKDQRKKVILMNESAMIEYIGNHPDEVRLIIFKLRQRNKKKRIKHLINFNCRMLTKLWPKSNKAY